MKKNKLLDRVMLHMAGFRCQMWTLTLRAGWVDDRKIMLFWGRIRAHLAKMGVRLPKYFWVKEFTLQGVRHLHIIVTMELASHIKEDELERLWYLASEKTSWIVDTGYPSFDLKNPAGYASKYLSEDLASTRYLPHERRHGSSQGMPKLNWKNKIEGLVFQSRAEKESLELMRKLARARKTPPRTYLLGPIDTGGKPPP
ncbi:MAG TPA: hypothetical protein V6C97_27680 [Oculatellaceae cyanobacterium]